MHRDNFTFTLPVLFFVRIFSKAQVLLFALLTDDNVAQESTTKTITKSAEIYQRFGATCYLHLHSGRIRRLALYKRRQPGGAESDSNILLRVSWEASLYRDSLLGNSSVARHPAPT
jgi:hypothetical protein